MNLQDKNRAKRFVILTVFAYSVGFGIIMPVLPQLIVELEQVSLSQAAYLGGWIAVVYAICQFVMGPLVGNLSDRYGRRPVFLLSLLGYGIDFLLMGLAPSVFWLFVGRGIAGALGAIFGPANAVMADISSKEERAQSFGLVGAAFGIGFIVGPAMGGLLGEWGTRAPFFVSAALAALVFCYGWFAFPETMRTQDRRPFSLSRANPLGAIKNLKPHDDVLRVSLVYFMWVICVNIYPMTWGYFAPIKYGWDARMVGISLTIVGTSMAFVQFIVLSRFIKRFGERHTAIFGMIFGVTAMLFFSINDKLTLALAVCLLLGIQSMVLPSINAMMSRRVPTDAQGELQGFNASLAALAALVAPLIYNNSLAYFTRSDATTYFPGAPFIISAMLGAITIMALASGKQAIQKD